MLDISGKSATSAVEAKAWSIEIASTAPTDGRAFIAVIDPATAYAVLTPLDLADAKARSGDSNTLIVVGLPLSAEQTLAGEQELLAWIGETDKNGKPPMRASARTARAVVCDNRALIYARDEHIRDALDGLVRFVVLQREVVFQETAIRRLWAAMEKDFELTHALAPGYNKRQASVNEMTELAGRAKASNLRTGIALAQSNPVLTDPSKRFFGEFAVVAAMNERYDQMIDPLTYAVETYERANTRMIETRNAAKERTHFLFEFILMAVIVVLIAWELIQMLNE